SVLGGALSYIPCHRQFSVARSVSSGCHSSSNCNKINKSKQFRSVSYMKKMNVESFNLDHTKVAAPYIRLAGTNEGQHGDTIYKFDIRFCQPNKEHMDMPALHSIEH